MGDPHREARERRRGPAGTCPAPGSPCRPRPPGPSVLPRSSRPAAPTIPLTRRESRSRDHAGQWGRRAGPRPPRAGGIRGRPAAEPRCGRLTPPDAILPGKGRPSHPLLCSLPPLGGSGDDARPARSVHRARPAAMPAGATWPTYLRALVASMLTMFAGAEVVHRYYRPDLVSVGRVPVAGRVCAGWRVCWRGCAAERSLAWRWAEINLYKGIGQAARISLWPVLGSSVEERQGAAGAGPVKGHEGDAGSAASLGRDD